MIAILNRQDARVARNRKIPEVFNLAFLASWRFDSFCYGL